MEAISERIKRFLTLSYGYGYSYGDGDGDGDGDGSGYGHGDGSSYGSGYGSGYGYGYGYSYGYDSGDGDGNGYGSGNGYGDGTGYGDGNNNGIKVFNGYPIYIIDKLPTAITAVHSNTAKGFIINDDLTTQPCLIVKGQDMFAHGKSLAEAQRALQDKILKNMDTDEKIALFLGEFKAGIKYPAKLFYDWHHNLTGSCKFGRDAFVRNHGIDLESGMYTVEEFIEYTKNDFGSEIIKQLDQALKFQNA